MRTLKVGCLLAGLLTLLPNVAGVASAVSKPLPSAQRAQVVNFAGSLTAGLTYRAEVVYRRQGVWWLPGLRVPYHHAVTIAWDGLADHPDVKEREREGERLVFTFEVLSKTVWKVSDRRQWRTRYECRVIGVEWVRPDAR